MADASLESGWVLRLVTVPALPLEGAGGAGTGLASTERKLVWTFPAMAHDQRAD